jgi:type VI protein secretion system component VasF
MSDDLEDAVAFVARIREENPGGISTPLLVLARDAQHADLHARDRATIEGLRAELADAQTAARTARAEAEQAHHTACAFCGRRPDEVSR